MLGDAQTGSKHSYGRFRSLVVEIYSKIVYCLTVDENMLILLAGYSIKVSDYYVHKPQGACLPIAEVNSCLDRHAEYKIYSTP